MEYDYNSEMLALYFKEKHYSLEKIKKALNENPFNIDYLTWEKDKIESNILLGSYLRENNIFSLKDVIQEISVHPGNAVSNYLYNSNKIIKVCGSHDSIGNIFVNKYPVLICGLFKDEIDLLDKLYERKINFVLGIATKDKYLYKDFTDFAYFVKEMMYPYHVNKIYKDDTKMCIVSK